MTRVRIEATGVLFDLDGVLVDSTAVVERHWRALADRLGIGADALVADVHGRRAADVIAGLADDRPGRDAAALARWLEQREVADTGGLVPVAGAAATLAALPAGRWAVVTSGTRAIATARLRAAGLPLPASMVTADDVAAGKPDPAPYLAGAAALGLAPGDCLAVEDAPAGLASARAAGCRTLALTTTHPATRLGDADHVARDLTGVDLVVGARPPAA